MHLPLSVLLSPPRTVISTEGGAFCRRSGERTPAFRFCCCLFSSPHPKIRHLDRRRRFCRRSGETPAFRFCLCLFSSHKLRYSAPMDEIAYVYIMSSSFQKLYIGVTSEIEIRVKQHKNSSDPDSHTARYRIDKLVYFERFGMITAAIAREKQLKRWSRIKKSV